jgi:hypothetical protein
MPLTLVEAAKGESNLFTRGVIETFTENQRLTQIIPYGNIAGSADGVEQEQSLPGADSRGVNEAFAESTGTTQEIVQSLKIYGGDIGIDHFILETKGREKAAAQVAMKIKAISNKWTLDFFKGDSGANARDFDGLQNRLDVAGVNLLGAGGAALSFRTVDEAISLCHQPQFIAMGRNTWLRFQEALRAANNPGGVLSNDRDDFGRPVMRYGNLELVMVTDNSNVDNILPFTEPASTSSLYVFGTGDEGIQGIQNGGFRVRNLGEKEAGSAPQEDTRVEWYNNFHVIHPRSAVRVNNFTDLTITT